VSGELVYSGGTYHSSCGTLYPQPHLLLPLKASHVFPVHSAAAATRRRFLLLRYTKARRDRRVRRFFPPSNHFRLIGRRKRTLSFLFSLLLRPSSPSHPYLIAGKATLLWSDLLVSLLLLSCAAAAAIVGAVDRKALETAANTGDGGDGGHSQWQQIDDEEASWAEVFTGQFILWSLVYVAFFTSGEWEENEVDSGPIPLLFSVLSILPGSLADIARSLSSTLSSPFSSF
jgi:hypothetical protein